MKKTFLASFVLPILIGGLLFSVQHVFAATEDAGAVFGPEENPNPPTRTKEDCDDAKLRNQQACLEKPNQENEDDIQKKSRCSVEANTEYGVCMKSVTRGGGANVSENDEVGFQIPDASVLDQFGGQSAQQVIGNFMRTATGIMGSIAFAIMVFAGFLWMTAGGNSDKQHKAMSMMVWASLGIIVILSGYTIVRFVFDSFTN